MKKKILFTVCLLFALLRPVWPQFGGQEAVQPRIVARVAPASGTVVFHFQVPAGYHITDLKNNFFAITLKKNDSVAVLKAIFPAGVPFGDENVFKGEFSVRVLLKKLNAIKNPVKLNFDVSFQICQEYPQELCYPPDQSRVQVAVGPDFNSAIDPATAHKNKPLSRRLEDLIRGQFSQASLLLFILVFAAGFLASLTPCVYPVIPIIMGYVGGRSGGRKLKGFTLSLFFVLGLSLVYSLLGVVAAKTGSLIGISFQNPIVVTAIAAIFIIMGLSLAGLFSIPVPAWISSKVSGSHKSDIAGALIVGGISAVIAAPCVGPVLIALLSWISQSGNVFLGFWLTFVFSLGMSVIFLVAGTFSGAIAALPRGGKWMSTVKYFFSALLIAGGIFFLANILKPWLTLLLWGTYLIALAVAFGLFRPQAEGGISQVLARTAVVLVFLCGAVLFYQGLSQRFFPTAVTGATQAKETLPWLDDLSQAKQRARLENKRLLIDAWAEWCAACRELDEKTFSRDHVRAALADTILVKLDFTRKNEKNDLLKKELGIIGMPTVIILDALGVERGRFSGFLGPEDFLDLLRGF
ncbi:MAG: thioredoxin family protein [Candidatus Aminicenantes bacterium]|nr:thioredoxin family protein [Candidatus Aminicenantes bacterium]